MVPLYDERTYREVRLFSLSWAVTESNEYFQTVRKFSLQILLEELKFRTFCNN